MQPTIRSSNQPLGGTSGDWHRRLLRFHLPLALASVMVIFLGLLAISSNAALRKLKAGPWKWLQRLNYALCGLVIAHAIFYGALWRVTSPSILLLGLTVIAVFVGQVVGVWLWRQRLSRTATRLA